MVIELGHQVHAFLRSEKNVLRMSGEKIKQHYSGGNRRDCDIVQNGGGRRYVESRQSKINDIGNYKKHACHHSASFNNLRCHPLTQDFGLHSNTLPNTSSTGSSLSRFYTTPP